MKKMISPIRHINRRSRAAAPAVLLILLLGAGCSQNFTPGPSASETEPSQNTPPAAPPAAVSTPPPAKPGSVTFQAPAEWVEETPSSRMRRGQYRLARAQGDSEDAEVLVFHFPGQGGALEANARRWIGQMRRPDGNPVDDSGLRSEKIVQGRKVVLLDVKGTYQSSMGFSQGPAKPGYRLLGAMLETPNGPWFFKLTGPEKTIQKWIDSWNTFTDSIRVH